MTAPSPGPVRSGRPAGSDRAGLGREFGKLWTGATASAIGDGLAVTAAPLMAAALTDDPRLIAGVSIALTLPYVLFGIPAGVLVDRVDRRRAMAWVDLFRAALVGAFTLLLLLGHAGLWALYACFFAIGTCETFFRNASQSLVPAVVPRESLVEANGRLIGAQTAANQFVGPLGGAALFALAPTLPFGIDALTFALSAVMLFGLRIARPPAVPSPGGAGGERPRLLSGLGADMATGVKWLARHRLLRNLALGAGLTNLVGAGAMAVLVVYAHDRLGLGNRGFGVLLACEAVGAVLASRAAPLLVRRIGREWALVAVAGAQIIVNLVLWQAESAWLAGAALALGAAASCGWDIVVVALRQTLIPDGLQGRVNSVYRLVAWGCIPVGASLAGALAHSYGTPTVYALGAVVMTLVGLRMIAGARSRWITTADPATAGAPAPAGASATATEAPAAIADPATAGADDLLDPRSTTAAKGQA
ncbi:MFS transporter [Kitasatospora sp. NPDC050543]|uniref:MFS transporter n=1 Tax=Kitasatospora sp. NPDC050543 TaxID=3364054 RepID=UPI0037B6B895